MKPALRDQKTIIPYDEIIMLHDQAYDESTPDELFNITIAEELGDIIREQGVTVTCMPFTNETFTALKNKKASGESFAIFNLVENVERKPEWQPRAMEALEDLGAPYTGTDTGTLLAV